jgi:hypothetical protein
MMSRVNARLQLNNSSNRPNPLKRDFRDQWHIILRVFENRVLRRIFEPNRDEVTAGWRKLHNKDLHNLYSSPSIIRMVKMDEMGGACSSIGEKRNEYRTFVGKPEGKRPLERPRRRWAGNIKMELGDRMGWSGVE